MRVTELLLESAKDRYVQMFNDLLMDTHDNKKKIIDFHKRVYINDRITWAIKTLRKDDAIVWYIKIIKTQVFFNIISDLKKESSKEAIDFNMSVLKNFLDKNQYLRDSYHLSKNLYMDFLSLIPNINTIEQQFEHFMSLPIKKIREYQFGKKELKTVLSDFESYEKEWIKKIGDKDRFVDPYGTKLLDVGDGFAWYDLEKGGV